MESPFTPQDIPVWLKCSSGIHTGLLQTLRWFGCWKAASSLIAGVRVSGSSFTDLLALPFRTHRGDLPLLLRQHSPGSIAAPLQSRLFATASPLLTTGTPNSAGWGWPRPGPGAGQILTTGQLLLSFQSLVSLWLGLNKADLCVQPHEPRDGASQCSSARKGVPPGTSRIL